MFQQLIGNTERELARQRDGGSSFALVDFFGLASTVLKMMTFARIVVVNMVTCGESRSASLMLPEQILKGIREGRELGDEMALTKIDNIKTARW